MDIKQIEQLMKLCQKMGVTQYTSPNISFTMEPKEPKVKSVDKSEEKQTDMYTEEDVLNWSLPSV